jgi:signal transduction histidine kinase
LQALNDKFVAAAASKEGGWVSYPWRTSASSTTFTKVAYIMPVTDSTGATYYAGAGFDQSPAPTATPCDAGSDAPCANVNVRSITGHAASMASLAATPAAVSAVWSDITTGSTYKVDTGFYVFAYQFDSTAVAHGSTASNVGKTLQQILDGAGITSITGAALNAKFVAAANNGGGVVSYPWGSGGSVSMKSSYVTKVVPVGTSDEYYVGSGFTLSALPAAAGACNAASVLADSTCQMTNSLSVMGNAQARLQACGDNWGCFSGILWDITYTSK